MTRILSANGLIEIPEEFRKADALLPGQPCEIERIGQGEYRLRVTEKTAAPSGNWVEWLLACPEKDCLSRLGSREDFDRFLAAVPRRQPEETDLLPE